MTTVYIKNNIPGDFVVFKKQLNKSLYKIGTTYEDYLAGLYVKLTPDQVQFKKNHPEADVRQVFYMLEENKTLSLDEIKSLKIKEIKEWDQSKNINIFYINNYPDWLNKDERMHLYYRLENEKKIGKSETTIWLNKIIMNTSIDNAMTFLIELENYAIDCLDTTKTHIKNILALTDEDSINNYNYKTGYPKKINIQINA